MKPWKLLPRPPAVPLTSIFLRRALSHSLNDSFLPIHASSRPPPTSLLSSAPALAAVHFLEGWDTLGPSGHFLAALQEPWAFGQGTRGGG